MVHCVIAGSGTLTVGEENYTLGAKDDVVLAPGNVDIAYRYSGGAGRYGIMEAEPGIEPRYTALQAAA